MSDYEEEEIELYEEDYDEVNNLVNGGGGRRTTV